jgi:hypothetical protein
VADDGLEQIREQLAALEVEPFLLSTASTIASLAYAKLEAGELDQAKKAIDALAALIPELEGDFAGELQQALTALQVAYATAASG